MAKYLDLDFKSASLYEYSGTKVDGSEKYTSSTGKVSYRKFQRQGVTGELLNVSIRDSNFGQRLQLALKTADDGIYILQFPLYDQNGNVDSQFAEPIIARLGNMQKGMIYRIFPFAVSPKDQEEYDRKTEGREVKKKYKIFRSVSIKLGEGTKIKTFLQYNKEGENDPEKVPALVWRPHPSIEGVNKPSAASQEERTYFLVNKLKEISEGALAYEAYEGNKNSSEGNSEPQEAPKVVDTTQDQQLTTVSSESLTDEDYDDLPF